MEMKFKHIYIENFCGISKLDADLYDRTVIKGVNRLGKSTIKNAIYWVLYNKMSDGTSPDGIRPHNENGKDIDFVEITAILTIEVNGREIELKKTQKQEWVKDRRTQEQRFKGNKNEYEINSIPKATESEFNEYIEKLIPINVLSVCTNPMTFLRLDTKKRRAKLCELAAGFTDDDVIATNPAFKDIKDDLLDGTIDELIARSKKVKSKLEDELNEIPARIDEINLQKVNIDVAEIELHKNLILEQIADNKVKQEEVQTELAKIDAIHKEIMDLKFGQSELSKNANARLVNQRMELHNRLLRLEERKSNALREQMKLENDLESTANDIEKFKVEIEKCRTVWNTVKASEFDENNLVCEYCGQEYSEDKKAEIKASYEESKHNKLVELSQKGAALKEDLDRNLTRLAQVKKLAIAHNSEIDNILAEIDKANKEMAELPIQVDVSGTNEYKLVEIEIAKRQQMIAQASDLADKKYDLENAGADLQKSLSEIEIALAKTGINDKIDERIEELTNEQRSISQKIANEMQRIDTFENFRKAKMQMLSDKVNQLFGYVTWQMFKEQVNGGYADVCIPMVKGTSYDGLLNHGDKILAEIDICKAFQKANNVTCPIMIDDTESLDSWRVPETDSQLIMLRRTDDKNLIIESEENVNG